MDWHSIIQALLDSGMTQAQIAEACETGQSHISGLYRGERKQPNWQLGDRLVSLHRERVGGESQTESTYAGPDRRTVAEPGHVIVDHRKKAA